MRSRFELALMSQSIELKNRGSRTVSLEDGKYHAVCDQTVALLLYIVTPHGRLTVILDGLCPDQADFSMGTCSSLSTAHPSIYLKARQPLRVIFKGGGDWL